MKADSYPLLVRLTSLAAIQLLALSSFAIDLALPAHLAAKATGPAAVAEPPAAITPELLVKLQPGTDVKEFARRHGLTVVRVMLSDPDQYLLTAASGEEAQRRLPGLRADKSVRSAFLNQASRNEPMAFVPNDPLFASGNPAGFPGQWHLVYTARPEFDSNVQGAWNRDLTGAGVLIGIADDGVETAHPDLTPNYAAADSYDFADGDTNPNPVRNGAGPAGDNHGTSVAGVAAARGGNGVGVTGAAPLARIAGLRLPFGGGGTVSSFVDATKYHSFGANRTIRVKNHSYGIGAPFVENRAERDAYGDSAAAGTIHVVSAGNERGKPGEDANKKDAQSSPGVIAVAAFGSSGQFASYSCFGANVFVTASSSSFRQGEFGVTTTDRTGDVGYNTASDDNPYPNTSYTADFGGTSSAAPLVAGIMALGVHANPNLDLRMAKHLLVRSCDVVDPNDATEQSDGGWKTNSAGHRFNQNYGFGLIDADEFTRLAVQFTGVTAIQAATGALTTVGAAVPDNGEISRTFTLNAATPLEEMEIYLNIQHTFRGDLEAYLTSPGGTTSRLFIRNGANDSNNQGSIDWWFTCNSFWGENPSGTWTLTVRDRFQGDTGTWNSFQYQARMGQLISATTPQPPGITGFSPSGGGVGTAVTITGTKFHDVTSVTFNGVNATFTINSATQITATVPAGAASGSIRVTSPAGTAVSAATFTVTAVPAITGFTPPNGPVGSTVVIAGANLTGATDVRFNGLSATTFNVNSATQITATVPAGATTGRISVTTPAGEATSAANFTVSSSPVVTGFSPANAPVGGTVTIAGLNFTGATGVSFGGVNASQFSVDSAIQMRATVPAGAVSGTIRVTSPNGTGQSVEIFTVIPPPTISNFTPASGATGSAVVISGGNLSGATQVAFNGISSDAFTVDSPAQITAFVPAGATTGLIRVTTPAGTAVSAGSFTVLSGPGNDSFANAQTLSGPSGIVTGSNVGATKEAGEPSHAGNPGGKSIWYNWTAPANGNWIIDTFGSVFDTTLALYTGNSVGALTLIAGNDDSGASTNSSVTFAVVAGTTYRIAVDGHNPDGATPGNARAGAVTLNWSQITVPPTIAGFSPQSGSVGSSVTISGANFAGATAVGFGGVAAVNFTVLSAAEITALVPPGAVTGPISVSTPAGTAGSAVNFTLDASPGNDLFANAQSINGNSGGIAGSNAGAGKEAGEPDHAGNAGGRSIWFVWSAPASGTWTFDTLGSEFDTLLAIYTGGAINILAPVGSNDDSPDLPGNASKVSFAALSGMTYRIAVDGYVGLSGILKLNWALTPNAPTVAGFSPDSGAVGTPVIITGQNLSGATTVAFGAVNAAAFTVNSPTQIAATVPPGANSGPLRVTTPAGTAVSAARFTVTGGPANDPFANAEVLTGNAAISAGSNANATREADEPNHAANSGGRSIWYRWTAPAGGRWTVDTAGSSFDTTLAVYTGPAVNALTLVGENDDAVRGRTSEVTFTALAGNVYQIAVDGYDAESGAVVLRLFPAVAETVLYATGFEPAEGFSTNSALAGQAAWEKLGTGGDGVVGGYFFGLGQQAYIGFSPPNAGDSLQLWRALNHVPDTNTRPVVRFSALLSVVDSINGSYDDFLWVVYNTNAERLFTLDFDNATLRVYYQLNSGSTFVDTGVDFENGLIYALDVVMDFARNRWSATLNGSLLAADEPISAANRALTLGDIDAGWVPHIEGFPGDNFMLFDNYRVAAEPDPKPVMALPPQGRSTLAGGNAVLGVIATGGEPMHYQWRLNGVEVTGATNSVLILNNVAPAQAGAYSVVVSNAYGMTTSASANLSVTVPAPSQLAAIGLQTNGEFRLTLTGTPGVRYVIEASTNLLQWLELSTPATTNGSLTFSDPAAGGLTGRFYRARELP